MKAIYTITCLMAAATLQAQTDSDFKTYSKFDFIPGEEVLFFDNFSSGSVGDFPASWNTNGSGELVTVSNMEGKWLKLSSEIGYRPQLNIKAFPENYTIEFDAIVTMDHTESTNYIELDVFDAENSYQFFGRESSGAGISVQQARSLSITGRVVVRQVWNLSSKKRLTPEGT